VYMHRCTSTAACSRHGSAYRSARSQRAVGRGGREARAHRRRGPRLSTSRTRKQRGGGEPEEARGRADEDEGGTGGEEACGDRGHRAHLVLASPPVCRAQKDEARHAHNHEARRLERARPFVAAHVGAQGKAAADDDGVDCGERDESVSRVVAELSAPLSETAGSLRSATERADTDRPPGTH
jgi:hypothetical protein